MSRKAAVILVKKWHEDKKLVVKFHYADDERRKRGVHGEQTPNSPNDVRADAGNIRPEQSW